MGETTYEQVGGADQVTNLTRDQSDLYGSMMKDTLNQLQGYEVDPASYQARTADLQRAKLREYDPMGGYEAFLGYSDDLWDAVAGPTSAYGTAMREAAQAPAEQSMKQVQQQLINSGLWNAGQTPGTLFDAYNQAQKQATADVLGMQTGIYGNLAQTALTGMPGQYQYANQMANELGMFNVGQANQMSQFNVGQQNQAAQFNAQQQMLAQQLELDALLGGGQLAGQGYAASQNWYEPSYMENESAWESWGADLTGALIGAAGQGIMGAILGSDKKLKKDIKSLKDALKYRTKFPEPKTWTWKNPDCTVPNVGFIAQEVEKLYPELVRDNGSYKEIFYHGFIPYIVVAIEELWTAIEFFSKEET